MFQAIRAALTFKPRAEPTTEQQRDRSSRSRWVTLPTKLEAEKYRHPSNRAYLDQLNSEGDSHV